MAKPGLKEGKRGLYYGETFKDSESMLLRLGDWVIFGIQALGYFPLCVNKRQQRLEWRLLSFPVLSNIVLLIMSLLWYIFFQFFSDRVAAGSGVSGDTEMVVFFASAYITTIVGTSFRLQACYRAKQLLGFWHENCHFLTSFAVLGPKFELRQYREMFGWDINFRAGIMKHVVLAFGLCGIYGFTSPQLLFSEKDTCSSIFPMTFYILCGVWSLMMFLHVLSSFGIVFFIKVYISCLRIVSHNLERLFKGRECNEDVDLTIDQAHLLCTGISFIRVRPASRTGEGKPDVRDEDTAKTLSACILAYELIEKQLGSHNDFFAFQTIIQILTDIFGIIINVFFVMLHIGSGLDRWVTVITDFIPIFAMSMNLHHLSSEATYLTSASKGVLDQLHRIPLHELSSEIRYKVQMLAQRISTRPFTVSPGNYFDLNRKVIASILSLMTTYLAVMVQFRSADRIKS